MFYNDRPRSNNDAQSLTPGRVVTVAELISQHQWNYARVDRAIRDGVLELAVRSGKLCYRVVK